jgi:threonine dehydrogenase-like Zn-dependent dehydrogenase
MKAMAVFPGKPGSIHLADLPEPSVDDVPDGRGVLVEVLRVGVDGTDKEINDAEYGVMIRLLTEEKGAIKVFVEVNDHPRDRRR